MTLRPSLDCQDAYDKGERKSYAVFYLRPDPAWKVIKAVCLFQGNGVWAIIQKRINGVVDFERGWSSYVSGFGHISGEHWLGKLVLVVILLMLHCHVLRNFDVYRTCCFY